MLAIFGRSLHQNISKYFSMNNILLMHFWCIFGALLMHFWCTLMHFWCIFDACLMHFWFTFDALLMHFWCTFDALLMHFWCTFYWFWCTFDALFKSASKVRQKCVKSASKVRHQILENWLIFSFSLRHFPPKIKFAPGKVHVVLASSKAQRVQYEVKCSAPRLK